MSLEEILTIDNESLEHETPDDQLVTIGYCHYGTVRDEFCGSLLSMYQHDAQTGKHWDCVIKTSGPYIAMARNEIVESFLRDRFAHWLLFLDNDVIFPRNTIQELLSLADPEECPILGGLYLTPLNRDPEHPKMVEFLPTWTHDGGWERAIVTSVDFREPLMELHSCGMGCTLIHRNVLETMREKHEPITDPWKWFGHDLLAAGHNGTGLARCGEDITFSVRARQLGFKIYGTPNVRCGHVKTRVLHPLSYREDRGTQLHGEVPEALRP
jgi:hypothetical protein